MEIENQTETGVALLDNDKAKELIQAGAIPMNKAEQHAAAFAPLMSQAVELGSILKDINVTAPTAADGKKARVNRLALVKVRTGATAVKKLLKENLISETKLIDGLFNIVTANCELNESELQKIEDFEKNKIAAEKAELKRQRELILAPYNVNVAFYDLENMDEETFDSLVDTQDRAQRQREKEEADRAEAEAKAAEATKGPIYDPAVIAAAERFELRVNAISQLGFTFDGVDRYKNGELAMTVNGIKTVDDATFQAAIDNALSVIAEEALKAQKSEDETKEAARAAQALAVKAQAAVLAAETEKAILEKQIEERKAADEAALLAKQKEAEAALLAPDKEKIKKLYSSLDDLVVWMPDFEGEIAKKIGVDVKEGLVILMNFIATEAAKLV